MTDYQTPETALLDLDWLIEQAGLFITANAVGCELEARLEEYIKVSGCPRSSALERLSSASTVLGDLPQEIRHYLSHVSVEEIYDPYLDQMGKLELVCRKAEVERRLEKMLTQILPLTTKQAA